MKFVLAFGSAPLGLMLVSSVYQASGGFYWVFVALAGSAALCLAAAFLLPRENSSEMPIANPAE